MDLVAMMDALLVKANKSRCPRQLESCGSMLLQDAMRVARNIPARTPRTKVTSPDKRDADKSHLLHKNALTVFGLALNFAKDPEQKNRLACEVAKAEKSLKKLEDIFPTLLSSGQAQALEHDEIATKVRKVPQMIEFMDLMSLQFHGKVDACDCELDEPENPGPSTKKKKKDGDSSTLSTLAEAAELFRNEESSNQAKKVVKNISEVFMPKTTPTPMKKHHKQSCFLNKMKNMNDLCKHIHFPGEDPSPSCDECETDEEILLDGVEPQTKASTSTKKDSKSLKSQIKEKVCRSS